MAEKGEKNPQDSKQGDQPSPKMRPPGSGNRFIFWILIAALLGFWLLSSRGGGLFGGPPTISYSQFRSQLEQDNIEQVTIRGDRVQGTLREQAMLKAAEEDTTRYSEF
ncbi:MAG: ATP-dependent metallopeptidase FtsH/Yme1/Tma family protein, partial [Balneolaceae bacterium]|nr:ATP-dependent metallopeptidase FtsH/Yme1/Tma family protein [Balneolaceae bacterium]